MMKLLSVSDLHGYQQWIEWVVRAAPDYDAILFPGDLIDGMMGKTEIQYQRVFEMLEKLASMKKPVIFCTGNHDCGLIPFLQKRKDRLPGIQWDGSRLELGGISIAAHPYEDPSDVDYSHNTILLHHEPPDEYPVALDRHGNSFGSFDLQCCLETMPDMFPPLIIAGHQHSNEKWHCRVGHSLVLNSGQTFKRGTPHHFQIFVKGKELKILHYPSEEMTRV